MLKEPGAPTRFNNLHFAAPQKIPKETPKNTISIEVGASPERLRLSVQISALLGRSSRATTRKSTATAPQLLRNKKAP